jgi:hypothetical protein
MPYLLKHFYQYFLKQSPYEKRGNALTVLLFLLMVSIPLVVMFYQGGIGAPLAIIFIPLIVLFLIWILFHIRCPNCHRHLLRHPTGFVSLHIPKNCYACGHNILQYFNSKNFQQYMNEQGFKNIPVNQDVKTLIKSLNSTNTVFLSAKADPSIFFTIYKIPKNTNCTHKLFASSKTGEALTDKRTGDQLYGDYQVEYFCNEHGEQIAPFDHAMITQLDQNYNLPVHLLNFEAHPLENALVSQNELFKFDDMLRIETFNRRLGIGAFIGFFICAYLSKYVSGLLGFYLLALISVLFISSWIQNQNKCPKCNSHHKGFMAKLSTRCGSCNYHLRGADD